MLKYCRFSVAYVAIVLIIRDAQSDKEMKVHKCLKNLLLSNKGRVPYQQYDRGLVDG